MTRRSLYRKKVQFSLRTLLMTMTTVAALASGSRWLVAFSLAGLGSFAIGLSVAVFAFRLLEPEERRTLFLQLMLSMLIGVYAFWLPASFLYYFAGVGVGLLVTWQGAAILTFLCAFYGIYEVKVHEKPRWQPVHRDVPWPMGQFDSTVV